MVHTKDQLLRGERLLSLKLEEILRSIDMLSKEGVPSDMVAILPIMPSYLARSIAVDSIRAIVISEEPGRGFYPEAVLHPSPDHPAPVISAPPSLRYDTVAEAEYGGTRLLYNLMLMARTNEKHPYRELGEPCGSETSIFRLYDYQVHPDPDLIHMAPKIAVAVGHNPDMAMARFRMALRAIMSGGRTFHPRMFDRAGTHERIALVSAIIGVIVCGLTGYPSEPMHMTP